MILKRVCLFTVIQAWLGSLSLCGTTYTIHFPAGYTLISIPTNVVGGSSLTNLFPGVYDGTTLFPVPRFSNAYSSISFDPDIPGWTSPGPKAGTVVFFYSFIPQTFTWEVAGLSPAPSVILASNWYTYLAPVNLGPSTYEDILGAPPTNETTLLRHVPGMNPTPRGPPSWNRYDYSDGAWSPSTPVTDPGEAVLVIYPSLKLKVTPADSPPGFVLTWPRGRLQVSDSPNGTWQTVTNASAPYRVNTELDPAFSRFYRIEEDSPAYAW